MARAVRAAVADAHRRGAVPILYGGNCASLLGSVPAAACATDALGLVCLDGHEHATPAAVSTSVGAANMEIGILAGPSSYAVPLELAEASRALPGDRIAVLWVRDEPWAR